MSMKNNLIPKSGIFCNAGEYNNLPAFFNPGKNDAKGGSRMSQLELMVEIGSESMRLARMYCEGILTQGELKSILGEAKMMLVYQYIRNYAI